MMSVSLSVHSNTTRRTKSFENTPSRAANGTRFSEEKHFVVCKIQVRKRNISLTSSNWAELVFFVSLLSPRSSNRTSPGHVLFQNRICQDMARIYPDECSCSQSRVVESQQTLCASAEGRHQKRVESRREVRRRACAGRAAARRRAHSAQWTSASAGARDPQHQRGG